MYFGRFLISLFLISVSGPLFAQNTSLVFKGGQNRELKGSNGNNRGAIATSFLFQTPDRTAEGKHFGTEMDFEVLRASVYTSSKNRSPFDEGENIHTNSIGYTVGISYLPLQNERLGLRITPFLGLSAVELLSYQNVIGYTGISYGLRSSMKINDTFQLLPEYRIVSGDTTVRDQHNRYKSEWITLGIGISMAAE